jgi:glycosyltransferase involved in cell wall biosynthesis
LRVAIVHSFYSSRNPSGENIAVQQQADALRRAGYTVEIFAQRTDERELRKVYPLQAAWHVSSGKGPKPNMAKFAPDIIHVHNLFPNYGKEWIRDSRVPVVASLHNYRPLCSAGIFFRDGHTCTECLDRRSSLPAVLHGCYKGRLQSVPVAIGQRFEKDQLLAGADAIIGLSEQMRSFYERAGVPPEKIHVLPNFLPSDLDVGLGVGGDYWLYAGRLSQEKGILPLVSEWPEGHKLLVVGSGEQERDLLELNRKNVTFVGPTSRARLLELMRGAIGLLFPSKCYEGFPMVYVEAMSAGTPVLTWEPSVVASLVREEGTGMTGNDRDLETTLSMAATKFPSLRDHCRHVFDSTYTEGNWITRLGRIYAAAQANTAD